MERLCYRYRPKPLAMGLCALGAGGLAAFMTYLALTNEAGMVINDVIELGVRSATVFYWCGAGLMAIFATAMGVGFLLALFSRQCLELTADTLAVPKVGLFVRSMAVVKLADVRELKVMVYEQQRSLTVIHSQGKVTIVESMLPDRAAFEAIFAVLRAAAAGAAKP